MIIVYTPRITDRLSYILDEIFTHRLGVSWLVTDDAQNFQNSDKPVKINYSNSDFGGLTVPNSGFLETSGIVPGYKPPVSRIAYHPVLFPEPLGLGFDVFAMAFWCLSRYEEYQPFKADEHGRFCASQSLFAINGVLDAPVLDIALDDFYQKCGLLPPDKYAVFPTLDIDIAFKHKGKGLKRGVLSFFKLLISLNIKEVIERISVIFGKPDPWDTFGYMHTALNAHATRSRFFIHCGPESVFDKPVSLQNADYNERLQKLNVAFSVGLHPSYRNGAKAEGILEEKHKLESFTDNAITRSRQHFLRMQLPDTYRNLIEAGITHDYTMGFPDSVGFRAGTGHSFRFYDLVEEKATRLVVHPFCAMDVSLKNYLGLNPQQAMERIGLIKALCTKYKLPFCFIFHNESLSDMGEWKGWREVFELCLK